MPPGHDSELPPATPIRPTAPHLSTPARPLRVLFVDHTAKLGGGEIALLQLIAALDRTAVEPILLTFEDGPLVERLRASVEVHVLALSEDVTKASKDTLGLRSALQFGRVWAVIEHAAKVRRLMRSLRLDLVHTNSLKSDIIGGVAGRLASLPVIWHVRDRIAPDYLPAKVVTVFRALSRVIPTLLIAVSEATRSTLIPDGNTADQNTRVVVVRDGIVLPALLKPEAPNRRLEPGAVRRIGMVGRICPWKGQHIFLESAALLHQRFPDARFEIIGAPLFDEQQYEEELHALCRRLEIEEVVTFSGFVQDVPQRMAELEIVVHASTLGEPFGLVIVEGMAQAKPVVATNGGGVPEIVVDGVTGTLVPMGDSPAMAQAIGALLADPESGRRMGANGRQRVIEKFTIERVAREVEEVYRIVVRT